MEVELWQSNQASKPQHRVYLNIKQRKKASDESKGRIKQLHKKVFKVVFNNPPRKVLNGKYLEKTTSWHSLSTAIDCADGELMSISKWVIKKKKLTLGEIKQKTFELQNDFLRLLPLKHPNLIHLLNWKCKFHKNLIVINLLMEYSGGINLSIYTDGNKSLPLETVRAYTLEILQALEYLHQNSVLHRNLRASNIIIDNKGNIRLRGYSLERKISDLHMALTKPDAAILLMPQDRDAPSGDIYQLGLILLAILKNRPFDKSCLEIPKTIPAVVQHFLRQCLQQEKECQQTAYQLLEHRFLKETIPSTPDLNEQLQMQIPDLEIPNENCGVQDTIGQIHSLGVSNSQSRFETDYVLVNKLGAGGFGEVFKVKHILDGESYAIKKIILDPKSKDFNEKIMREVKMLSCLKHDYVVRYFCSWIEYTNEQIIPRNGKSSGSESEKPYERSAQVVKSIPVTATLNNTCSDFKADVEKWIPTVVEGNDEWGDEEDLEQDIAKFEKTDESSKAEEHYSTDSMEDSSGEDTLGQILYIQMECCDERTMKTIIDEGLYTDKDRVWRLFKEIVEGLVHIHEKNIIHCDLKPVNIFLDPFDHVKIGDFGLARHHKFSEVKDEALNDDQYPGPVANQHSLSSHRCVDGSLTGDLGTSYYKSPELKYDSDSLEYDQKVDLYSLGVIFFEMCYRSLPTGMERDIILTKLTNSKTLPDDFSGNERTNEAKIIFWLLNHDPNLRPTSKDLLSSDYLPPGQVEETEVKKVLQSALCNPQSASHCQILKTLFDQKISKQQEVSYDHKLLQDIFPWKKVHLLQRLGATLIEIFSNHGAVQIQLPLFMPVCSVYDGDKTLVKVLNQNGIVVSIPRDQRVPLARYISKQSINLVKYFAIEQSFKVEESTAAIYNVHPMRITECIFDIISPPGSLLPDAEILVVIQEIINTFQSLKDKKYYIQINHVLLLKAVLMLHSIPEYLHSEIFCLLAEAKSKQKQIQALLKRNKIMMNKIAAQKFFKLLQSKFALKDDKALVKIFHKRGPERSLALQGLNDIKTIVQYATSMGLKLEVKLSLSFIHNPKIYSAMVFQVLTNSLPNGQSHVLATGGRYDKLIENFLSPDQCQDDIYGKPTGVGLTLMLESIAFVVAEDIQLRKPKMDIAIFTNYKNPVHEELDLAKRLWEAGFKTTILDKIQSPGSLNFDECQKWMKNNIFNFLQLKSPGIVEVTSLFDGWKVPKPANDLIMYLKQLGEKEKSADVSALKVLFYLNFYLNPRNVQNANIKITLHPMRF